MFEQDRGELAEAEKKIGTMIGAMEGSDDVRRMMDRRREPEASQDELNPRLGNVGLGARGDRIRTCDLQAMSLKRRTKSRQSTSESPSAGGR